MSYKPINAFLAIVLFVCSAEVNAQGDRGIVKGIVADSSTGETLPYTNVLVEDSPLGAVTDVHGLYIITNVPYGLRRVRVSTVGYETQVKQVMVYKKESVTCSFRLRSRPVELQPIVRMAERGKSESRTNTSVHTMTPEEIKLVPATVQSDLLRALRVFPGVVSTSDVTSQFFVRGGGGDQNLILLDGMTVYNPFHALGLFSIFDGDAIKAVNFFTGGFGSEYGTRLSSVLDISTRDGNRTRLSGKLSGGLLTAKALLEGPLGVWDGSWMVSVRKSHFDTILKRFLNEDVPLSFYDLIAKVNVGWGEDTRLSFQSLLSADDIRNSQITEPNFQWKNQAFGISLSQLFSDRFLAEGTFSRSFFKSSMDPQQGSTRPQNSSLEDAYFNASITYYTDNRDEVRVGFTYSLPELSYSLVNTGGFAVNGGGNSPETSIWAKYRWLQPEWVNLEVGLRVNYISLMDEPDYAFEPRLSVKFKIDPMVAIKGSWGRYFQRMITISNEDDAISLFETWVPIKSPLSPESADHYILGFEGDVGDYLHYSLQGYYKYFKNLIGYNRDKIDRYDPDYVSGTGKAYGFEVYLKAASESSYGWLSYTLGSSTKTTNSYTYPPRFDRTHSLSFVGGYRLSGGWDVNVHWEFGSGLPFTKIVGFYDRLMLGGLFDGTYVHETGEPYTIMGSKNGGRLPAYHRLDFGVSKLFYVDPFKITLEGGVVNVYDRANIFYFNRSTGERVNMLPFMPTINLNVEF